MSHVCNFRFLSSKIKKGKRGKIAFNNTLYLAQCAKNIIILIRKKYKKVSMRYLTFFYTTGSKSGVYFTLTA